MASDFEDRIKKIASDYADKLSDEQLREEKAKQRQEKEEQDFLAAFRVASERFILPKLRGLEAHSNEAVRFSALYGVGYAALKVSAQMVHNQITFQADYKRHLVTVTTNDKDPASIELPQLGQNWVEEEVEKRVNALLPR